MAKLEAIQKEFNGAQSGNKRISLADLIAVNSRCSRGSGEEGGHAISGPFLPDADASQEQTDVESFAPLEPIADGFRNYRAGVKTPAEELLLDRAMSLAPRLPEMTVLVGGLRALHATFGQAKHGVLTTSTPGTLTNDFFVNLLDMGIEWRPGATAGVYEGRRGFGFFGDSRDGSRLTSCSARIPSSGRWPRSMPATQRAEIREGFRRGLETR